MQASTTTADGGVPVKRCAGIVCDPNATCSGTGDEAACACQDGYEGNGQTCDDIDECAASDLNDCDENADCTNLPAAFSCTCRDGFVGDGKSCEPVDECQGVENTCDPNAVCIDENPGFSCECGPGFDGDGTGCRDLNECDDPELYSCAANAHCENTLGGFDCACDPGFRGDGNEACTALCDAARADSAVCAEQGLCRVTGVQAACTACQPGFTGDGKDCSPADCDAECDGTSDDADNVVCEPDGSCACAPGYTGSPGSCTDVDECGGDPSLCGENAACTNEDGGYLCACLPGYVRDDAGQCVDRDECADGSHLCHPDAVCENRAPADGELGYTCTCNEGFSGDGFECADVDECTTDNGGCPDDSECSNTRGGFECRCPEELIGEPGDCHCDLSGMWAMRQDVDTCWAARDVQDGLAQKLISAGSMEATVWELYEITYDGTEMQTRKKGCNNDNTPDLVSPLFRETYSSYIPLTALDGIELGPPLSFEAPGLVAGSSLSTPSEAGVLGIDLGSDPVNAAWPASTDTVPTDQWRDSDGDGEPGVTLWSHVPSETTESGSGHYSYLPVRPGVGSNGSFTIDERVACLSIAARVVTHLEGRLESCTRITGDVINESSNGRVHSCTLVDKGTCDPDTNECTGWEKDVTCTSEDWKAGIPCDSEDLARLDDDQNQKQYSVTTFELVKIADTIGGDTIDGDVTCDTVRSELGPIERDGPTIACSAPE